MKKVILIVLIIIIVFLLGVLFLLPKKDEIVTEKEEEKIVVLQVGEKYTNQDLVDKKYKVINDDIIDTSELKNGEVTIEYNDLDNKKSKVVKYEVKDTIPPVVILNSSYSVVKDYDKPIESAIFCKDNYDTKPNCKVEGEYNLSEIGEYEVKYIAIDSSNNKTEIPFTLKVIEKQNSSTNNSVTVFKDVYDQHKKDNTEIGIDVSKWQGNINFTKVKNAGASFVMIRLGYQDGYDGKLSVDPYFKKNIEGAISAGLDVGVYFFSYAKTVDDAKKQVEFITDNLSGYDLKLPIVLDWENWSSFNNLDMNIIDLNKMASAFLDEINNKGYKSMIYGSKNYLNNVWIYNNDKTTWLAHYTTKTDYDKPYMMWQLCSNGKIDGINGYVDIDIKYN